MSKKIYNEFPFSEKLKLLNNSKNSVPQRALANKYKILKGQVCSILKRKEDCANSNLSSDLPYFPAYKSTFETRNSELKNQGRLIRRT